MTERVNELLKALARGDRELGEGSGASLDDVLAEADALLADEQLEGLAAVDETPQNRRLGLQ